MAQMRAFKEGTAPYFGQSDSAMGWMCHIFPHFCAKTCQFGIPASRVSR
jgi:hypothetical protein